METRLDEKVSEIWNSGFIVYPVNIMCVGSTRYKGNQDEYLGIEFLLVLEIPMYPVEDTLQRMSTWESKS